MKWILLAFSVLLAGQADAQTWPNRTIRAIAPYPPGGAADATARLIAQELQKSFGVTVVVENRSGASGTVGGEVVRQAAPDGYTLLISPSSHTLARLVLRAAPYDPQQDFTPIGRFAEGPMLVLANPAAVPGRTIAELLPDLRAQPERYSMGLAAFGAASHLVVLQFARLAGVELNLIPYRGSGPALTDLISGQIQLMIDPGGMQHVRDGRLLGLAITGTRRHPALPEVPTAAESGMPGLELVGWYGIWGPRALPEAIAARINAVLGSATQDPAFVQRLHALGLVPATESPGAFAEFIADQVQRSAALLREARFQPE